MQASRDQSQKRRVEHPQMFQAEQRWMSSLYLRPLGISDIDRVDQLEGFKKLIWDMPSNAVLDEFGSTPEEMAKLCGEGSGGWILSSQIAWYFKAANRLQKRSLCICMGVTSRDDVKKMIAQDDLQQLEQLVIAVNVGKYPDNTVYVGNAKQPGCHWALTVVQLTDKPRILYCDSKGWDFPASLLPELAHFTNLFGISKLKEVDLQLMHTPTPLGTSHTCDARCCNYPVQKCSNVCGIVTVVCGVVAALDQTLFKRISGARAGINGCIFLCYPTKYENYLRRVLMYWYTYGLDISFIQQDSYKKCPQVNTNRDDVHSIDHAYFSSRDGSSHVSSTRNRSKHTAVSESANDQQHASQKQDQSITDLISAAESIEKSDNQTSNTDMKSDSNTQKSNKEQKKKSVCCFCSQTYTTKQALYKHKQTKHPTQLKKAQENTSNICHCQNCDFKCLTLKDLIHHYNSAHHRNIHIANGKFRTENDFLMWKKSVELSTSSLFVKACGTQYTKECIRNYFYCNRSGVKEINVNRKRALKAQGSCKIGFKCTAFIITSRMKYGSVRVEYCLDHTDHLPKLAHTKLSEELQLHVAGKLDQGCEIDAVLDDIRNKITDVDRDSLLTEKDIHNIKKQFNITKVERHEDDGKSIDLWIHELRNDQFNPIVFYKPQNTVHDILKQDDFLLCIQTNFQRKMLKLYGHKIICIDSTHCTNQYDFMLTTVLVLDEYEAVIPVAWAISNRDDTDILQVFFHALENTCGQDIKTGIFMSDLANNFYNGWCAVFSKPIKRLFCSWHVDKAWRNKIREHVKVKENQCSIYMYLKVLQEEPDEGIFRNTLQSVLTVLQYLSPTFHDYFDNNYVQQEKFLLWATCYRTGSLADTNMFVEGFHHVLEDVYFNKEQNKRLDRLLIVLLKIARDKCSEQLIKSQKDAASRRLKDMKIRHVNAFDVKNIEKCIGEQGGWTVPSTAVTGLTYSVAEVNSDTCLCKLLCPSCHVCLCRYTCTCTDFLIRTVPCKHIHAVHMLNLPHEMVVSDCSEDDMDIQVFFPSSALEPEVSSDINRVRMCVASKAGEIVDLVKSSGDINIAQYACEQLQNILSICSGMHQNSWQSQMQKKQDFPHNKGFETQHSLYSTKKKRKSGNKLKQKKPDVHGKPKAQSFLSAAVPLYCTVCCQIISYDSEWIQCTRCAANFHKTCNFQSVDSKEEYVCFHCRPKDHDVNLPKQM